MAKTHYYFGAVAEFIINAEKNWISSIIDHHRGFRIGFLFLSVMKEIQSSLTNQPPVRFNDYKLFECQNYNMWETSMKKKVLIALHTQHFYNKPQTYNENIKSYRKVLSMFTKCMKGAGDLTLHHSIGIMSCIGIIPKWIFNYASIQPSSRYMKYFQEKYDIKDLKLEKCINISNRIINTLSSKHNVKMSLRTLENVLCKYYRETSKTNSQLPWRDIRMLHQDQVIVHHEGWSQNSKGNISVYHSTYLIDKVSCEDEAMPICDVHKKMKFNQDKSMSLSQLMDMVVPKSILLCHDDSHTQSQIEYHGRRSMNQNSYVSNYIVQQHIQLTPVPKRRR